MFTPSHILTASIKNYVHGGWIIEANTEVEYLRKGSWFIVVKDANNVEHGVKENQLKPIQ